MTTELDFQTLRVFAAVAEARNFTGAGEALGLTQSAVSRRIQDLEETLGISLINRTTRRVSLTPAGEHWLREAHLLLNQRSTAVREFREIYGIDSAQIRLGLGDTIPFAHLPGILDDGTSPRLEISTGNDEALLEKLTDFEIDLAVTSEPETISAEIEIHHSYDDPFILISPMETSDQTAFIGLNRKRELGRTLAQWVEANAPGSQVQIEVDTFDLAINLVSLGFGSALVPRRALAVYGKRKPVQRFNIDPVFSRRVIVAGRKSTQVSEHVAKFIESILFSESN